MRNTVIHWLRGLLIFLPGILRAQALPDTILIEDNSFDKWYGTFNYRYEISAYRTTYWLYRTWWEENDTIRQRRKRLKRVPRPLLQALVTELQTPHATLTPADLGYAPSAQLQQQLRQQCLTLRSSWNPSQIAVVEAVVAQPENLAYAVNRNILRQGYFLLHSSGITSFRVALRYPDHRVQLAASRNYLGLPWRDEQRQPTYNPRIAPLLAKLLPAEQSFNHTRFQPHNLIPRLASELYEDKCREQVDALTWQNFRPEFDRLRQRFDLSHIRESVSGNWQWDFDRRLEFEARDATMPPGVYLGVGLTIQNGRLFPPDSLLLRADYYLRQLQRIPFLLNYVAADSARKLAVSFNNTVSVSAKISEKQRLPVDRPSAFLPDAPASFLNRCLSFELTDEQNRTSRWVLTPELELILHWYNGSGVLHYSRQELDGPEPTITFRARRFDLHGRLLPH